MLGILGAELLFPCAGVLQDSCYGPEDYGCPDCGPPQPTQEPSPVEITSASLVNETVAVNHTAWVRINATNHGNETEWVELRAHVWDRQHEYVRAVEEIEFEVGPNQRVNGTYRLYEPTEPGFMMVLLGDPGERQVSRPPVGNLTVSGESGQPPPTPAYCGGEA